MKVRFLFFIVKNVLLPSFNCMREEDYVLQSSQPRVDRLFLFLFYVLFFDQISDDFVKVYKIIPFKVVLLYVLFLIGHGIYEISELCSVLKLFYCMIMSGLI